MKSAIGILCGGKSRRMGQDKAFLKWKDTTMLNRMVQEMSQNGREVFISASEELALEVRKQCDVPVISDEHFDHGPLEGIRCLLHQMEADTIFFCAVDMPFISLDAVTYLEQKFQEREYESCDALVLEDGHHIHPLCGVYKKRVITVLEEQLAVKNYRVMAFLKRLNWNSVKITDTDLDVRVLWNANTPEEYERALKELKSR